MPVVTKLARCLRPVLGKQQAAHVACYQGAAQLDGANVCAAPPHDYSGARKYVRWPNGTPGVVVIREEEAKQIADVQRHVKLDLCGAPYEEGCYAREGIV